MKVLIVEDDKVCQKVIESIIQRAGAQTVSVNTGVDAILKDKIENFDLMILDIMLPESDGPSVANHIIQTTLIPKIIVVTAAPELALPEWKDRVLCVLNKQNLCSQLGELLTQFDTSSLTGAS